MNPQFVPFGPTGQSGYYDENRQFIPMDKQTFDTMFSQMRQNVNNPYMVRSKDNYTMAGTNTPSSMPRTPMVSAPVQNLMSKTPVQNLPAPVLSNPYMPEQVEFMPEPIKIEPIQKIPQNYDIPQSAMDMAKGPMPTLDLGKKGSSLSDKQKSSLIGAGINMGSKLIRGLAPDRYDQRVGMEDPNAVGTILGDTTFTQMGSSIMPGIGTAIGGGLDIIKNLFTFGKKEEAYNAGKRKADINDYLRNKSSNQETDVTGYARHGIKAKNPYLRNYGKFSSKMKKR